MTSHNWNYDSLTRSLEAEVEFLDFCWTHHAQLCLFTLRMRASYLTVRTNFLGHFLCSVEGEKHDGINDVGWRWVFGIFWKSHAHLCLFTLRVRASYLKVWTFEATFHAQWKPRILTALTMLAEVECSIFFCSMMTSCAYSLCACGRGIWRSELLRPLFMLSESRKS